LTARRPPRPRVPLRRAPKLAPDWFVGSWQWFRWFVQGPSKFDSPRTNSSLSLEVPNSTFPFSESLRPFPSASSPLLLELRSLKSSIASFFVPPIPSSPFPSAQFHTTH